MDVLPKTLNIKQSFDFAVETVHEMKFTFTGIAADSQHEAATRLKEALTDTIAQLEAQFPTPEEGAG